MEGARNHKGESWKESEEEGLLTYEWKRTIFKKITLECLKHGMPKGVVLNVNFPKLEEGEIKGIKVCRQAKGNWEEVFDKRQNPQGQDYYWLSGKFVNLDKGEDTDEWALSNGYASLVPVHFDLTAHHTIQP